MHHKVQNTLKNIHICYPVLLITASHYSLGWISRSLCSVVLEHTTLKSNSIKGFSRKLKLEYSPTVLTVVIKALLSYVINSSLSSSKNFSLELTVKPINFLQGHLYNRKLILSMKWLPGDLKIYNPICKTFIFLRAIP